MRTKIIAFFTLLCLATSTSFAADRVKVRQGAPALGTITKMTADQVVVEQGPLVKRVPVTEIISIEFEEEPAELGNLIRSAYEGGRYQDAIETLGKIDTKGIDREAILQDIAYYKAASAARLALAGSGSAPDAGRQLVAFESKASQNYHYWDTCQLLGELLVFTGKPEAAARYFDKLSNSELPEVKLKGGVLSARSYEANKQYEQALAKYDAVISNSADSKEAQSQKYHAECGKATTLAAMGKVDEAIKIVDQVLTKADDSDRELLARAYNALGSCYVAANKKKEALIAYLHTDLLFANYPEQHAEALAALSTLWIDADKADRAAKAKASLQELYPGSRWAKGK
jgi:tetratricopeptide (TPR) repeat protein